MDLTDEEAAIIRNYRKLSRRQKEAVLASEWSFKNWIKSTLKWVWEKIMEWEIHHILDDLFNYLTSY